MTNASPWKTVTIAPFIELINGFAFPSDRFTEEEGMPLIRIRDLDRQETEINFHGRYDNRYLVKRGDLLIGMDGDFLTVKWKGRNALLNQRVCKLVAKDVKHLNQDFLFYRIIDEINHINRITSATTVKHLSSRDVLGIKIDLPPKPEQTKIAEILSTVDRAIEQTEALIAKQQRIKTGLMQDLLTRGIDEHGNLRSEQTHQFKDSPLGRIPVEWEVVQLGNVSEISSGVTLGKIYSGPNTIELPYLRVANVQDGYLDLSEIKVIRVPKSTVKKYQLKAGDVLMNEGGDFDKLGRGTVWNDEIQHCLHQNHIFKVRPKGGKLSSDYLAAVSASPYGKAFFILSSKQSTNLASINSTQLKSFPVPLPLYDEQLRIESLIKQNVAVHNDTIKQLRKVQSLKKAIMQDLLTGKKRVTFLLADTMVTN